MVRINFGSSRGGSGRPTKNSKFVVSLFFLVFFAMGSLFEVLVIRDLGQKISRRGWLKTPCTIVDSSIREDLGRDEKPFRLAVRYEYEYQSKRYTSATYKSEYSGSDNYEKTSRLLEDFPVGGKAHCYVNPKRPSDAFLRHDSFGFGFIGIPFALIFVLIGAGGIYFTWRKPRRADEAIAAETARKAKFAKPGGVVLFAIFAIVGLGMLYPLGIRPIVRTIDAESWRETPCRILSAKVRRHESNDSDGGTTYSVDIFYEYEFNGRTWKSNRYGFMGGSSSGYGGKAKVVEEYKKARNPVCYVNPENPGEAVLKRGFHAGLLLGLIPLAFVAVGIGGVIYTLRGKGQGLKSTTDQWMPKAYEGQGAGRLGAGVQYAAGTSGPVTLRCKHSRIVKLLGAIAIAVFWNGVVSIFLVNIIREFKSGLGGWLGGLFIIPFVVIGLGMIGYVIYRFLAMFNPRPVLTLSSGRLPLGGVAELRWGFSGIATRISHLRISLQGQEKATYRRGTKTRTDTETFYDMELVATDDRTETAFGNSGFVIPHDTMHSFEGENNKIVWSILVHGDIKSWPDVKEGFEIIVTPGPVT